MKTIEKNVTDELIINKSRFIGYLYKVDNVLEINNLLLELRSKYKDANHICYAYSLLNTKKSSDDKEPNGTAGLPILEVLNKNDLVNVLAVVVRYFGGIKLGSGGLIRAYSNTIRNTLEKTIIKELKKGYLIKIVFEYDNVNLINNLVDIDNILEKEFEKDITYLIKGDNLLLEKLDNINQKYEIISEIYL